MLPAILLTFAFASCCATSEIDEFVEANHKFSAALYKTLAKTEIGRNFLICPLSIETTLALAWAGARNDTADEITRSLYLPNDRERVYSLFKNVGPTFKGNGYYNLSSVNKIFLKSGLEILDEYRKVAMEVFKSEVEDVDIAKPKEVAAQINEWVEKETNDKIHDLIADSDINSYTRLILVNALYFSGHWINGFNVKDTIKGPFYRTLTDIEHVDTMYTSDYFKYHECSHLKAKFLQLPYEGDDVTMIIVLPDEKDGLAAIEARSEEIFIERNYTVEYVTLSLPKFTIESRVELKPVLKSLGIEQAFDDRADFSGITSKGELYISKAIQKTFINVTEDGTEAAAATVAEVEDRLFNDPSSNYTFQADHPFLFGIFQQHKILFLGRYVSPNAPAV